MFAYFGKDRGTGATVLDTDSPPKVARQLSEPSEQEPNMWQVPAKGGGKGVMLNFDPFDFGQSESPSGSADKRVSLRNRPFLGQRAPDFGRASSAEAMPASILAETASAEALVKTRRTSATSEDSTRSPLDAREPHVPISPQSYSPILSRHTLMLASPRQDALLHAAHALVSAPNKTASRSPRESPRRTGQRESHLQFVRWQH